MNSLRTGISEYLELRRSLGFRLEKDERLLLDFADFMDRRHAAYITVKLAVEWAQQPESTDQNYLAGRLRAVRSFTRYRILTDPRTEIPPTDVLPRRRSTFQPHIFSEDENNRPSGGQPATAAGRQADLVLVPLYNLRPAQCHRDASQRSRQP
jgi:hypothetical protein